MEDQQPDPGDLTTDPDRAEASPAETPAEAARPARGRRWPWQRRRAQAEATVVPADDESAAPAPEADADVPARTPVGKSRRTRRTAAAADETVADETVADEVVADEPVTDEPVSDADETGTPETVAEDTEPEPEPVLVPHRPVGRRLVAASVVAGALFVGAAAFTGSQLQPYLADRAAVDTKLDIARTAAEAIATLWTYTPDDMETLPDRSSRYLTGEFAEEYRRYIDAIVATNKQAQVSNTTEVMGAAVESLTPTEATALVYTNSVSTSPVNKNIPSLRYLSYRLTLQREDAHWMITRMNAVTKLDLTPQL